jgi:NAD(P)-dependent dehydrogenase (short-subunit alcohol dehydrogenase family)
VGYIDERAGLRGRVAVIFGGGGGLGRACALDLGGAGVRLALNDRNPDLLAGTADELRQQGTEVMTSVFDARDPDHQATFFDQVDATFGGVDILINVVGGTFPQPFADSNPRGWDALIRTNFTWLLHAVHLAIPRLRARGGGSIIQLTSIEAHRAAPGHAVYSAMKAAVENLSRTLAVELAPDGIRVNTIAPDFVPTEGLAAMDRTVGGPGGAEAEWADVADRIAIPMGRRGRYDDVGGCALFLASDLSGFVTGTTLHPDGGTWASSGWFHWPEDGWSNRPPGRVVDHLVDRMSDPDSPT